VEEQGVPKAVHPPPNRVNSILLPPAGGPWGALGPRAFRFLFNAQFFGADVASLLPRQRSQASRLGTLVAIVIGV
jgi:hypothetical protein